MNMKLTQKETDLAGITTSSLMEEIEGLLSAPINVEMDKQEAVAVIQVLRLTNSKLLKRAIQLEQARAECQKDSQLHHQERSLLQTQLAQKMQELETAQEQIKLLKQEQQALKEKNQQQEILNEGLTVQLQTSQERVNQLEHEWLLTQATHNEQTYQLRQSESTCQELRNRLTRQQRYTMQLKVALEKCLDQPEAKSEVESDRIFTYQECEQKTDSSHQVSFAQVEPIPPWSIRESKIDCEVFATQPINAVAEATTNIDETLVEAFKEQFPEAIAPLGQTPEEQHNAVLNLLSDTSCVEAQASDNVIEVVEVTTETLDQSQWLEATFAEVLEAPAETNCDRKILHHSESSSVSSESTTEFEPLPTWEEPADVANPNWPSPVLNPSRSKKRKTLAAIELPNFAHIR
ncbi:hypothetical protein [Gloeocapsopsis sp. IPPAS B-1203]|uniref:hypothetical protein n=1 Tax=Gloeocapsopsis sp. IPPAS B-1203 TaxID=2049454 RepID=UPI00117E316C|nr:hypothetical protein [Gloeocapsopsis sp. IPPAS B-1203]